MKDRKAPRPGLPDEVEARFARCRGPLLRWFGANRRDLPWRVPFAPGHEGGLLLAGARPTRPPYAAWVSEIMLQQTQVATVAPRFAEWIRRFPDVATLARASEDDVLRAWAGLGYYARARNLHRGAKALLARGEWPHAARDWRAVPGVGDYTAGAVASIVFGLSEPILDGNVARVLSRLLALDFLPGDGSGQKQTYWDLARLWASAPDPGALNEALMELGALVCTPAAPRCEECPLRAACIAREEGRQADFPPRKRRATVERVVAVAVVATLSTGARGRVLLEERARGVFLAGHAMFPLFLGPEARGWKASFRKRFPRASLSKDAFAGTFRHAIMAKRYEVEVRPVAVGGVPAGTGWVSARGLAARLTNSLAKKVWEASKAP
jgi:A/G-specific adenine glycosylase